MTEFHCEILTPHRLFFTGQAESVTFVTHDGEIEVLASHEPFVTPVLIGQLRIRTEGQHKLAAVTAGFARVKAGRIDIFVDAAEWPEEIDRERAERALARANERLATVAVKWQLEASALAAARARNRLAISAMVEKPKAAAPEAVGAASPRNPS
ncbi:MAG TPA: ATP synthase F1 subunit epsilon [Rectinemataceae bacterium]|nr:ATP synthase F1 subunit epsilon [Rectinemataceae bacterium]